METLIKFVVGGVAAVISIIVWQALVSSFWQNDDTRLAAVAIGVGGPIVAVVMLVGLYKKFANGGW